MLGTQAKAAFHWFLYMTKSTEQLHYHSGQRLDCIRYGITCLEEGGGGGTQLRETAQEVFCLPNLWG